ncbi:unnamed protein product [Eruca vesicaria subsp. sativa]|uniref:Uncharacterized protein n=1 Tax=Eruca vesicaria subsp. sativa TaxID=29727 RepID=A0ABC8KWN4_ERUVS|nr:unnamed protein product [Eruca vesicaria subsp. sativa]
MNNSNQVSVIQSTLSRCLKKIESTLRNAIVSQMKIIETALAQAVNKSHTVNKDASTSDSNPAMVITPADSTFHSTEETAIEEIHIPNYFLEMPSFSLGLSQDEPPPLDTDLVNPISYVLPPNAAVPDAPETRRSKRARTVPAGLQDYKCDPKVIAAYDILPDIEVRFKAMEETVIEGS